MQRVSSPCPVPGSVGWTGFSDKTFEFAYSPLEFIKNKTKEHRSTVFKVRVLNKPTIFLTSSDAVKELLEGNMHLLYRFPSAYQFNLNFLVILFSFLDQEQCFEMGYRDLGYMHSLFGDLVLFFDEDDNVTRLRGLIHSVFIPQTVQTIMDIVNKSCDHHLPEFEQPDSIAVYDHFKQLTTEMCLSLFLGFDSKISEQEMKRVAALTTTHWHGNYITPVL
jgi:cytochrome P450